MVSVSCVRAGTKDSGGAGARRAEAAIGAVGSSGGGAFKAGDGMKAGAGMMKASARSDPPGWGAKAAEVAGGAGGVGGTKPRLKATSLCTE